MSSAAAVSMVHGESTGGPVLESADGAGESAGLHDHSICLLTSSSPSALAERLSATLWIASTEIAAAACQGVREGTSPRLTYSSRAPPV